MKKKLLKIAQASAASVIVVTLLLGLGWRWFWWNYSLMYKIGERVDQYEKGDNRTDND